VRPVTAVFDCATVGLFHTTREPMASFVAHIKALEQHERILSVSLGHGFPWGDVADNGANIWVTADGDLEYAEQVAEALGQKFIEIRAEACAFCLTLDQAFDEALARLQTPVVLADVADNPGGGAAGDSTFILEALLSRGIGDVAIGGIWDPQAVDLCFAAGVGAELPLRIGGKTGRHSGQPVDLQVRVRALAPDHSQKALIGRAPLGRSVWVSAGSCDLLLVTTRNQIMGQDSFTGMGIALNNKKLVVVKSAHHFYEDFAMLCPAPIYVSTPGVADQAFAKIAYVKRSLDYWPRNAHAPASLISRAWQPNGKP
jgi:microcystin degradation protein MlrC